jgi:hypothetical protein
MKFIQYLLKLFTSAGRLRYYVDWSLTTHVGNRFLYLLDGCGWRYLVVPEFGVRQVLLRGSWRAHFPGRTLVDLERRQALGSGYMLWAQP